MGNFKVGDRIRVLSGKECTIIGFDSQGDPKVKYDDGTTSAWYSSDCTLIKQAKGKRGRPRTKPKPIKFLLKYDLDEDPIEEFSTMDEVRERIDYLVKNERSLKRDSMVVYEIRSKKTVSVETKIKLSK
jgi:hypothetical protein